MKSLLNLEDFGAPSYFAPEPSAKEEALDQELISQMERKAKTSYDTGYQAGWDDAISSVQEDNTRISAELERNLREMGFAYHEARSQMLQSIEHLLMGVLDKALPEVWAPGLAAEAINYLTPHFEEATDLPVRLVVSPEDVSFFEVILQQKFPFDVDLVTEEQMSAGHVYMRLLDREASVDFPELAAKIKQKIQDMYDLNKETDHG